MYYSKRQLYALGEPLGDSVTQRKAGGGMIYGGGGGGSPAGPTNTTVTNTNIPDYAQPYVSNMLNAAQAQIYTPDMTGFNPYTPYSTNPQDYVASFSPLQQQAQSTAANMQVPGQYGAATGQTMRGIMGANQIGRQMQGLAASANPYDFQQQVGGYMNPYIQQSLDPQLQLANQQYGIAGQQMAGQATGAGAFGGSRNALQQSLNAQNQMLAQNQLISQGYNTAFNAAQNQYNQSGDFQLQSLQGALGAQQQGMAGAAQLGSLGQAQLAAQQGIANMQNQYGAQQQNQQQNVINQAVQNYATAQQYPYMQLGQLNAMLRGLPMQQSSTSMYQAAPSTVSQLSGLGIAGLGGASMYNAATKASGGEIKAMAVGGAVPMSMMSDQQLGQVQQNPTSSPMAKMNAQGLEQLHGYIHNNPQAGQMIQQGMPQQMAQVPQDRSGVASIATPPQMTQMAGGGIIAFADEGAVKDPAIPRTKSGELDWASILAPRLAEEQSGKGSVSEAYKPLAQTAQEDIKQQRAMLMPELATRFGLGLMNSQGGRGGSLLNKTLQDVGVSGLGAVQGMTSNLKDINAAKKTLQQGTIEATKADEQRRDQLTGVLANVYGTEQAKKIGLAQAAATLQAGLDAKQASLFNLASTNYATQVKGAFDEMSKLQKNSFVLENKPRELWNEARRQVYETLPQKTRDLLQLEPPKEDVVPPVAAPAAATVTPVQVTIPAANGRGAQVVSFPSQAAADQFTNSPQYKAYIGAPAGQKTD
jgi:hypothetical protein